MNWAVLFKLAMSDIRKVTFSQRKAFFEVLTESAHRRAGLRVAWPDAMMFLEPSDWFEAAKVANIDTSEWT